MTNRAASWGGVAVDGCRTAAGLTGTAPVSYRKIEPNMRLSADARLLAVLERTGQPMLGKTLAHLANVGLKTCRRRLGHLAASGRIVECSPAQSVLDRRWKLP